jgi:hypothetical protein
MSAEQAQSEFERSFYSLFDDYLDGIIDFDTALDRLVGLFRRESSRRRTDQERQRMLEDVKIYGKDENGPVIVAEMGRPLGEGRSQEQQRKARDLFLAAMRQLQASRNGAA